MKRAQEYPFCNVDDHIDIVNALIKGDKDSAYRIVLVYQKGINGLKGRQDRMENWLAFAAELDNGIASCELAEIYASNGQTADQVTY